MLLERIDSIRAGIFLNILVINMRIILSIIEQIIINRFLKSNLTWLNIFIPTFKIVIKIIIEISDMIKFGRAMTIELNIGKKLKTINSIAPIDKAKRFITLFFFMMPVLIEYAVKGIHPNKPDKMEIVPIPILVFTICWVLS